MTSTPPSFDASSVVGSIEHRRQPSQLPRLPFLMPRHAQHSRPLVAAFGAAVVLQIFAIVFSIGPKPRVRATRLTLVDMTRRAGRRLIIDVRLALVVRLKVGQDLADGLEQEHQIVWDGYEQSARRLSTVGHDVEDDASSRLVRA